MAEETETIDSLENDDSSDDSISNESPYLIQWKVKPFDSSKSSSSEMDLYDYEHLLNNVFHMIKRNNPGIDAGIRRRIVMKPPQLEYYQKQFDKKNRNVYVCIESGDRRSKIILNYVKLQRHIIPPENQRSININIPRKRIKSYKMSLQKLKDHFIDFVIVTNFVNLCLPLKRESNHIMKYILSKLMTKGFIEDDELIIIGKYNVNQFPSKFESLIRNYMHEFIRCNQCGSKDTELQDPEVKENGERKIKKRGNRLTFLNCKTCYARRSLLSIKSSLRNALNKSNINN